MKAFVKHLWLNNREEIIEKSLLHCHCKGLHSIILLDSPGKTVRLYISTPESDMYKNLPGYFDDNTNLSLGFHPHHCNLTLHCIKGSFVNWEVIPDSDGEIQIDKYLYQSKITADEIKFKYLGIQHLKNVTRKFVSTGNSIHMYANELHTVGCAKGELSAWLVYEGQENPDYIPYCWSNSNPNEQDFTNLYVKPTEKEIKDLLELVDLL